MIVVSPVKEGWRIKENIFVASIGEAILQIKSVRDKVDTSFNIPINSTEHLIQLIKQNKLPDNLMFTIYPQRWTNHTVLWTKELIFQNMKT